MANSERKLGLDAARDADAGLESGRLVRRHRPALGESFAEHAQLERGALYPGVAMLEASKNYSVGRGTDAPFEQIGADWIHGPRTRHLPERPIYPRSARLSDALSTHQLQFRRTDRSKACGSWLPIATRLTAPGWAWNWASLLKSSILAKLPGTTNRFLIGNRRGDRGGEKRSGPQNNRSENGGFSRRFRQKRREKYLLYR